MLRYHHILQNEKQITRNWLLIRSFSTTQNYYKILGVPQTATKEEIKKAYFDKVKQCHPDHYPGDEKKNKQFQDLQRAYEKLSDDKFRNSHNPKSAPSTGHGKHYNTRPPSSSYPFKHPGKQGDPFSNSFKNDHSKSDSRFEDMVNDWLRRQHGRNKDDGRGRTHIPTVQNMTWTRVRIFLLFYVIAIIVLIRAGLISSKNLSNPPRNGLYDDSQLQGFLSRSQYMKHLKTVEQARSQEEEQKQIREIVDKYEKGRRKDNV